MLLRLAPLFFAVIVKATPSFPNATISSTSSSSSTSSDLSSGITSSAALSSSPSTSSTSSNASITSFLPSAYYNPFAFENPYYFYQISASDELESSSYWSCGQIWDTAFTQWLETAAVSTGPIVPASTITSTWMPWISTPIVSTEILTGPNSTWISEIPGPIVTHLPSTVIETSTGCGPYYYVQQSLDFTASPPCCASCTVYGGNVQVYYWPTQTQSSPIFALGNRTQSPPASTLVNDAGFTFVSPSVYVAFKSVYAANLCGDVGPQYAATTLAFPPGELSTSEADYVFTSVRWNVLIGEDFTNYWTQATFGDQTDCADKVHTLYDFGGMGFSDYSSALSTASSLLNDFSMPDTQLPDLLRTNFFTYNLCNPTLSIPSQILTMNPLWSTCLPPVTAFFDPPYALSTGNGLSAFEPPVVTGPASPGPTLEPLTASVTTTNLPTPVVAPSSPAVQDPSVSSTTRVNLPPILAASSVVPTSSPIVQTVKVLTPADSSTSNPAGSGPEATVPVANNPTASDPSSTDPSQNPAGQSSATTSSPAAAILSFGSSTITADQSSNFVFASETLTPGGQLTVSGTQLSLASSGGYVIFGGSSTQTLATAAQSPNQASPDVGSYSADLSTVEYIFASQTLRPNGPAITVSGTILSLQAGGSSIVIGGTTTDAIAAYLATSTPEYIIGTQTLKVGGPAITLSGGTVLSLLPGASSVLVGASTVAVGDLTDATTTEVPGIGGIIMTLGGYGYATDTKSSAAKVTASGSGNYSNYNGTMFYGGAGKLGSSRSTWALGLSLGLGVLSVCWL